VRTDDLDYALPPELVAQEAVEPRDAARLLVVDRASGVLAHRHVRDLPELVRPDDLVVVNTTRVRHARLRGHRATGGAVEVLLLAPRADGAWDALARPARRLKPGEAIAIGDRLTVRIVERAPEGGVVVRLESDDPLEDAIERAGVVPLPPYIRAEPADPGRYQTVYAERTGSAAAPTAGLHLTPELLETLRGRTAGVASVDLEIGLDTFRPVAVEDVDDHPMHAEAYRVDPAVRARVASAPGRVLAVGTTTVRVLETVADPAAPDAGLTRLKIQPGYAFRTVGALLTNFHLPRSTLLALVMAFAGEELVRTAYAEAIRERYRFYSFGDAMLVV
jgi:S-adenosylmethionine:tRNA ribosyltransferase-isomerase